MKILSLIVTTLVGSTSIALAQNQIVYSGVYGTAHGESPYLKTTQGKAQLAVRANSSLKGNGDSIYFVMETIDYKSVVVVSAEMTDGKLVGPATRFDRASDADQSCAADAMKSMSLAARVMSCYFKKQNYALAIEFPRINYDDIFHFLDIANDVFKMFSPLQSEYDMIDNNPQLKTTFLEFTNVYRTTRLHRFLAGLVLSVHGYVQDITNPDGWAKRPQQLNALDLKFLNGIRTLIADDKMYLSVNVHCHATADLK
ncbi:MAG: hypothetical protein IT289_01105, partial [Oligoflexia bacterium]|nr:hypothetical protein [Oligoflexia bacterium]